MVETTVVVPVVAVGGKTVVVHVAAVNGTTVVENGAANAMIVHGTTVAVEVVTVPG